MGTRTGIWIDHRKAVIVTLTEHGETIRLAISNAEKQMRRSGDSPMKGDFDAHHVPADDKRQRRFNAQLNLYYDAIIATLRNTDAILLFGPGQAKAELKHRLEQHQLAPRVVALEPADKMSDRDVAKKVREFFAK